MYIILLHYQHCLDRVLCSAKSPSATLKHERQEFSSVVRNVSKEILVKFFWLPCCSTTIQIVTCDCRFISSHKSQKLDYRNFRLESDYHLQSQISFARSFRSWGQLEKLVRMIDEILLSMSQKTWATSPTCGRTRGDSREQNHSFPRGSVISLCAIFPSYRAFIATHFRHGNDLQITSVRSPNNPVWTQRLTQENLTLPDTSRPPPSPFFSTVFNTWNWQMTRIKRRDNCTTVLRPSAPSIYRAVRKKEKKEKKKNYRSFVAFVAVTENVLNLMIDIKRFPDYRELYNTRLLHA